MDGLDSAEILEIWEHGEGRPQWQQALLLAARAARPLPVSDVARLEIGERDRLILGLRRGTLGSRLDSVARCPGCGAPVEFSLAAEDLCPDLDAPPRGAARYEWEFGTFRLPATMDVTAATSQQDLFERCAPGAPSSMLEEWERQIESRDPLADVIVDLECGACRHAWKLPLDATLFFWRELRNAAKRLIQDVAALASRYGWSEDDVLRLSARRRRMYLEVEEPS